MPKNFFDLSAKERNEALEVAATTSGRPTYLLEKDVWVVWTLHQLFTAPFAGELTFKGGTSLSKAYGLINRFSEDIDITRDIRTIIPEQIRDAPNALPRSLSQAKRWRDEIEPRLADWISNEVAPLLIQALSTQNLIANIHTQGDKIFIEYQAQAGGYGYVTPRIQIEFGARATGEPNEIRLIYCDAAMHLTKIAFPTAKPRVMRAERTFWEKATAIHVFCLQHKIPERSARHWSDLAKLDSAGIADSAINDRDLARSVADHKSKFFSEKDASGAKVDYHAAVAGELTLVPIDSALKELATDYDTMVKNGLFQDSAEPFDTLIERCRTIQKKANAHK